MFIKALNVGGILCNIKDNCVSSFVIVNWILATILLAMLFVYTYQFPGGHYGATKISWHVFDCWYLSMAMNCPCIISWCLLGWTMEIHLFLEYSSENAAMSAPVLILNWTGFPFNSNSIIYWLSLLCVDVISIVPEVPHWQCLFVLLSNWWLIYTLIVALCLTLTVCSFTSQALGCVGNCYI